MADQDDQQPLDTTNPDNENVAFDLWDDPFYSIFDDDQFGPTALPNIHSSPTSNVDIASPLNPMEDPLPWEFHDDLCESIRETLDDSGDNLVNEDEDNTQHTNTDFVNTMPLAVWPPLPVPFSCSCCQVLREIIYCNGTQIARLEIHGRVGIICHAIKEIRNNFDNLAPTVEYVMIDFTTHSIENVKRYLIQYCQEQRQAGYVMTRDPLSAFYDALCAGQNWDESNIDTDDYLQDFQTQTGQEEENEENRLAKSGLAAQRERTAQMNLEDLRPYFHLPIEEAARRLQVCPTVLKRICRKHKLKRWPHRKLKSLDRQISNLEASLRGGEDDMRIQVQIEGLRQQRDKISTIRGEVNEQF